VALLLLKINYQGAAIALAFFGFSTLLNGSLVFRSGFLPRALGVLSMVSGLGWPSFLMAGRKEPAIVLGVFL
jgi:hypothetical protein